MSGCYTCGGYGSKHDPITHGQQQENDEPCNGMCVMGNEVMPGGGYYDWAAYPHPDCPRHGRPDIIVWAPDGIEHGARMTVEQGGETWTGTIQESE